MIDGLGLGLSVSAKLRVIMDFGSIGFGSIMESASKLSGFAKVVW